VLPFPDLDSPFAPRLCPLQKALYSCARVCLSVCLSVCLCVCVYARARARARVGVAERVAWLATRDLRVLGRADLRERARSARERDGEREITFSVIDCNFI